MKKISIIVPCFNEEQTVDAFYEAVLKLWNENTELNSVYEKELLFINDGSKDATIDILKRLSEKDESVHYTSFSRNFGKEAAVFCGLKQATGDNAVIIDADLQHPVETIPLMLKEWERGFEVVEGIKLSRGKESLPHKLSAKLFYGIIGKLTGFDMKNSSDFKLLDRKVIDALNDMTEKDTFFRAMSFWVGFKSTTVEYVVADRIAGESKWSTKSLIKYAVKNIIAFTYTPLYLIFYFGFLVFFVGLVLGIDALISYFLGNASSGYPSLMILLILSSGAILLSLGIIAVYIAKIYSEIKNRPRYIVDDQK